MVKYTAMLACGNYHGVIGFAKAKGPRVHVAIQKVIHSVVILFKMLLFYYSDFYCFFFLHGAHIIASLQAFFFFLRHSLGLA